MKGHGLSTASRGCARSMNSRALQSQTSGSINPLLLTESPGLLPPAPPVDRSRRHTRILVILFLCTLPLANPIVHGDGVGYYAYFRAPLIEHNFDFPQDYQHANPSFRDHRLDESGQPKYLYRTRTGHLVNHFTVGPAIL